LNWLVNAVISVLVHLFIRMPIMRYSFRLVCGIVFIILASTLAVSPELFWFSCALYF